MSRILSALTLVVLLGTAAHSQTAPAPVAVTTVTERKINSGFRSVGTVQPMRSSVVGSPAAGRVEQYSAKLGEAVSKGDTLAKLRTGTLQLELGAAQAELEFAEHQLAELKNGSRPEEIAAVEARARGAEAAMNNAQTQLKRFLDLSQARAATQTDLEDAREREQFTRFAYQAAKAQLNLVRAGPRAEKIAQAQAQVALQGQQVALIEDRIDKHTIRAPFDGFIAAEFTQIGAWLSSGDPVASVVELREVEINVPATAEIAVNLKIGATVRVEFPELPNVLLTGTLSHLVPVADTRSRTFPVLVRLKNPITAGRPLLLAGMLARAHLPAGKQQLRPLVPKDAIVLNDQDRSVFIIDLSPDQQTGTARKESVKLGVATKSLIQVTGNVKQGDLVVIEGNERLQHGDKVQIIPAPMTTPHPDT